MNNRVIPTRQHGLGIRLRQLAILILLFNTPAVSLGETVPDIPKSIKVISSEQLKDWFDNKKKFLLVDSRVAQEFKTSHIPRAIHVYDKDMDGEKAKFPSDKDFPIVFYCNGYPKCVRSLNGAKIALSWGHRNIYLYTAGIPDWEARGYPLEKH